MFKITMISGDVVDIVTCEYDKLPDAGTIADLLTEYDSVTITLA